MTTTEAKMKLILHIGTEKTGTTTLQSILHQNRSELLKEGFYFTKSAGLENNREFPVYFMLNTKIDDFFSTINITTIEEMIAWKKLFYEKYKNELLMVPNHVHTVIISSEHFHSCCTDEIEIENIYKEFSLFFDDIKIIVYLRNQVDLANSWYSTRLKHGIKVSCRDFVKGCVPGNHYYDFDIFLSKWEKVFGAQNMTVRVFEKKNNHIDDFFSIFLNPDCLKHKTPIDKNPSLNRIGQILARVVNNYFPLGGDLRAQTINKHLLEVISKNFSGFYCQLRQEEIDNIQEQFNKSNDAVCKKYFPSRESLFQDKLSSSNDYDETLFDMMMAKKKILLSSHLFSKGFYADEGGRRWMSQAGEIIILEAMEGDVLQLKIVKKFSGSIGGSIIKVSSEDGREQSFSLPGGAGIISYPLANLSPQTIKLTSLATARSPYELEISDDIRQLTFMVGDIDIISETN